jgi:hypothetical protein
VWVERFTERVGGTGRRTAACHPSPPLVKGSK